MSATVARAAGARRAARGRRLHDPDRRARGGRDARVGRDDDRRRARRARRRVAASATPTPTSRPRSSIDTKLADVVRGRRRAGAAGGVGGDGRAIRNLGRPGIASMAIAAVDLRALGSEGAAARAAAVRVCWAMARESVPVYGSGGFTAYSPQRLAEQLGGWVERRDPAREDEGRARPGRGSRSACGVAREAIGPDAELFVDANGAYTRKQALGARGALRRAEARRELVRGAGVLRRPRRAARCCATGRRPGWRSRPASTATTCRTSRACSRPTRSTCSRPTSPAAPASPSCCASTRSAARTARRCRSTAGRRSICTRRWRSRSFVHLEYFHDHVRIERMLFDGVLEPRDGALCPISSAPATGSSSSGRRRAVCGMSSLVGQRRATAGCSRRSRAATAAQRAAARRRDLLRPLQRLVRRQVDVGAGRAVSAL